MSDEINSHEQIIRLIYRFAGARGLEAASSNRSRYWWLDKEVRIRNKFLITRCVIKMTETNRFLVLFYWKGGRAWLVDDTTVAGDNPAVDQMNFRKRFHWDTRRRVMMTSPPYSTGDAGMRYLYNQLWSLYKFRRPQTFSGKNRRKKGSRRG